MRRWSLDGRLQGFDRHLQGSACASSRYTLSHVLKAMGLDADRASGCVRISGRHLTPAVDWDAVATRIRALR